MEKDFIITNLQGLHARPATRLVNLANSLSGDISITYDGVSVDMKSIMGVLSLGIKRGSLITVITEGEDHVETMKALTNHFMDFNLR